MREDSKVLGIDLGGTKISVSLWTSDGRRLESRGFPTIQGPPEPNLAKIVSTARELLGGERPRAIGLSGGGPLDPERGVIILIPNLPGWIEVPIARSLQDEFGAPVAIENDANACAIAEHRFGAGRGSRHMIFLTLSTGIGGGLILNGQIYRGHRFLAGEAGPQVILTDGPICGCGNRGCLEALASGTGIIRRLEEKKQLLAAAGEDVTGFPRDAREIVEKAKGGDFYALEFLRETAEYLAHGIANLVFVLDPERIILGTIAVAAGDLLLEPLRAEVSRLLWPAFRRDLKILPAGLGGDLGDYAAFAVAPL